MDKETFLIVGLGNPGARYAMSRHNCGFQVIDRLWRELKAPAFRDRLNGRIAEVPLGGARAVLCEPTTFMNASGDCVSELVHWYKCPLDHLLVIYDDVDLPVGVLRMRKAGSAGTHNGMRSILSVLPSGAFPRLRIGIGSQPEGWDLADWVLASPASREELACLESAWDRAARGCVDFVLNGTEHAMQLCNGKN